MMWGQEPTEGRWIKVEKKKEWNQLFYSLPTFVLMETRKTRWLRNRREEWRLVHVSTFLARTGVE